MRTSATPSGTTQANGKAAGCGIDGNIPSYNTGNVRLLNMCEWKVQWQLSIRVSRCSHGFDRRTMHRNIHNRFAGHAERYVQLGDIVNLLLDSGEWLNKPSSYQIKDGSVIVDTDPETDFWQRSYYGFRNDNAPALLFDSEANFTISVQAGFNYQKQFDQCGLIIYLDSENWFKASIEYENSQFSRLGSVVTNNGYSDWATSDIQLPTEIWYRLSRRGPDFLIEYSFNGSDFIQMRIFHLHSLGETTEEMGKVNPPLPAQKPIRFGVYACSPCPSSFRAVFSNFKLQPCTWLAHSTV